MPTLAGTTIWQVPETCGWNRYIHHAERALVNPGWTVVRPGICPDEPDAYTTMPVLWNGPQPQIVHLHWPEKLSRVMGSQRALTLLRQLKANGSRIVQTIHNVSAHEAGSASPLFQDDVDALTDGVHFFSADHELIARANRPMLPGPAMHLAHPLYDTTSVPRDTTAAIGCFGRLREYKRTADFVETLLEDDDPKTTVVVAGHPDSDTADRRLRAIAQRDTRLTYRPGFTAADDFQQVLNSVEWVALPYRGLHSSGVLVEALQADRRILSPMPVGGTELYGSFTTQRWLTLDRWDDALAVQAWRHARQRPDGEASLGLPDWATAAARLTSFYSALMARPSR